MRLINVVLPEGPVTIERYDPNKGQKAVDAKRSTFSAAMLWRVANGMQAGQPVNLDRLLGASYNNRSALEALLAHSPEFFWCLPGRIEYINSSSKIVRGHKHLIWLPDQPHEVGKLKEYKTDLVISELPSNSVVYEALSLGKNLVNEINLDIERRH